LLRLFHQFNKAIASITLENVFFQNVGLMVIPKCSFYRVRNVLSGTSIFAAISKISVAFEEVLTKDDEQEHFLRQNATLPPINFTIVWLKCATDCVCPGPAAMQFLQPFRGRLVFREMVTQKSQKTADLTPTNMQKQRQECVNIQHFVNRQCLPTALMLLQKLYFASKAKWYIFQ